jgi:hypothetical protein
MPLRFVKSANGAVEDVVRHDREEPGGSWRGTGSRRSTSGVCRVRANGRESRFGKRVRERIGGHELASALNHEIFDGAMEYRASVVEGLAGQGRGALFARAECPEAGKRELERAQSQRPSAYFSQVFGALSLNSSNTSLCVRSGGRAEFAKRCEDTHRPAGVLSTETSKKVRVLTMVADANAATPGRLSYRCRARALGCDS